MKIAVVDNLPIGGAKRVVWEQIKSLSRHHEIFYYTNTIKLPWSIDNFASVETRRFASSVDFKPLHDIDRLRRAYQQYRLIQKSITNKGCVMAIVHPCRVTQAPVFLGITKLPTLYYAHEWLRMIYEPEWHRLDNMSLDARIYTSTHRKLIKFIDKTMVGKATWVAANSVYTQGNLAKAYGVKADVVTPGVDTSIFKPKPNTERRYFLFIGERDDYHGYPLIDAIKQRIKVNIKTIDFAGSTFRLSDQALVDLYQGAIATICLDHQEPFGLVPLESMACETPVIAVDEGGYSETVVNNETGFLIDRSSEALLATMMKLAKDKDLAKNMGKTGRKRVKEIFSWDMHSTNLENIIQRSL